MLKPEPDYGTLRFNLLIAEEELQIAVVSLYFRKKWDKNSN